MILGYMVIVIYPTVPVAVQNTFPGKVSKAVKYKLGFGPLFDRAPTLEGKTVSYRFYQNGTWQPYQQLLEPSFKEYRTSGNIGALRHCRLDARLLADLNIIYKSDGLEKMKQSNTAAVFLEHLVYRHNKSVKPDSVEVNYYKIFRPDSLQLLLNFKSKP